MPAVITAPAAHVSPKVPVDFSALPVVAGSVGLLLNEFLMLLTWDIQQQELPAPWIEVRGTTDMEDDTAQILVRLWTDGLSDWEARQYQSEFGSRVDVWVRSLSQDQQSLFAEKISFQARRAADA